MHASLVMHSPVKTLSKPYKKLKLKINIHLLQKLSLYFIYLFGHTSTH